MSALRTAHKIAIGIAVLIGLYIVAVLGAIGSAKAAGVGDEVNINLACKTQETIRAQVDAIVADKSYARANLMLAEARAAGECATAPGPVPVIVLQVAGPPIVLVDSDGDTVSLQVIMVEVGGVALWSVDFRVLPKSSSL